jgi:hypothetical protein
MIMGNQIVLIEYGYTDALPPGEKHQGLDGQEFSDGSNGREFVLRRIVKENQTIERPTLTEIREYANVQISTLVGKVPLLVKVISLQNDDDKTNDEFEEDVLQDPELAIDEKGTRPMDAFVPNVVVVVVVVVVDVWIGVGVVVVGMDPVGGSGGRRGSVVVVIVVGSSYGLPHQPGFQAQILQSPHVDATRRRLVLEHQDQGVLAAQDLNQKLQKTIEYVRFVPISQGFDVNGVILVAEAQPRFDGINGDHPEYANHVTLDVGLVVMHQMHDDAVNRNGKSQQDKGAGAEPGDQVGVGAIIFS